MKYVADSLEAENDSARSPREPDSFPWDVYSGGRNFEIDPC